MKKEGLLWTFLCTKLCSFDCKHCINKNPARENILRDDLSMEQIKKIIDNISMLPIRHLALLGGEPLFRKDLNEICNYLDKKEIPFGIISNGVLWDEKKIQQLLAHPYLHEIVISMDGHKPEIHGITRHLLNHSIIEHNLKNIISFIQKYSLNISVSVNTVIHKENYRYIPEMILYLQKLGISTWNMLKLMHFGIEDAYQKLQLSQVELEEAHQLLYANLPMHNLKINPYFSTPHIIEYYNQMYHSYIELPNIFEGIGIDYFSIDNDGSIYPSLKILEYDILSVNQPPQHNDSLLNTSVIDMLETPRMKNWFIDYVDKSRYQFNFLTCYRCSYLHKLCFPRLEKKEKVEDAGLLQLCWKIEKKIPTSVVARNQSNIATFEQDISDKILVKNIWTTEMFIHGHLYLFQRILGKFVKLSKTAEWIWQHLSMHPSIDYFNQCELPNGLSQKDIILFCNLLFCNGFLIQKE